MTNQLFCYWLQGYFEILNQDNLEAWQYKIIDRELNRITEDLGLYTNWLRLVVDEVVLSNFDVSIMQRFTPIIKEELNLIFLHVIDDTYEAEGHSKEILQNIHDGKKNDE